MLKLRLDPASDPPQLAGVIERLGTAERRTFETLDELSLVLLAWMREAASAT